ncbi:MAG: hypothetical protein Q8P67_14525, partial [archaeon]|nr:hypothetical protein [archaeon]
MFPAAADHLITSFSPRGLREAYPNVLELNISGHLLAEWVEVFSCAASFPKLRTLCASRCRCELGSFSSQGDPAVLLPELTFLILNDCGFTDWREIDALHAQGLFPSLSELQLQQNGMVAFCSSKRWEGLSALDISRNLLADWGQVIQQLCAQFPDLTRLVLSHNALTDGLTQVPDIMDISLGKLTQLSLDHCQVRDWATVYTLGVVFPNLQSLRFGFNPLTEAVGSVVARHLTIVMMPALTKLNGSDFSSEDRSESEKFFLQWFQTALKSASITFSFSSSSSS